MALTHTYTVAAYNGANTISKSNTVSQGGELEINEAIPANQTNLSVAFAFVKAKLQYIMLVADVNMTLKTNSSGAPQETINLLAGFPYFWELAGGYFANPFIGNVTSLFVTNTTAGTLQIRGLVDVT